MKNREKNINNDQKREEELSSEKQNQPQDHKPLPGEYPASEDIMNRQNHVERVPIDPDSISRTPGRFNNQLEPQSDDDRNESASFPPTRNTKAKGTSESDLTKEDYEALGPRDLSLDGGDDEQLKHRVWPVDFGARDLDVPHGDDTERIDALGQGDEENDHYSLGGDDKDSLEDDPTRTFG